MIPETNAIVDTIIPKPLSNLSNLGLIDSSRSLRVLIAAGAAPGVTGINPRAMLAAFLAVDAAFKAVEIACVTLSVPVNIDDSWEIFV